MVKCQHCNVSSDNGNMTVNRAQDDGVQFQCLLCCKFTFLTFDEIDAANKKGGDK